MKVAVGNATNRILATVAGKPKIFISYRHSEHHIYVGTIADGLRGAGFRIWLEERQRPGLISRFLRADGKLMGLNLWLRKAMVSCDATLFLVPARGPSVAPIVFAVSCKDLLAAPFRNWQPWLRERLRYAHAVLRNFWADPINFCRNVWYKTLLGVELGRKQGETWQEWEGRVSQGIGTPIVHAVVVSSQQGDTGNVEDAQTLRADHLAEDLRERVAPVICSVISSKFPLLQEKFDNQPAPRNVANTSAKNHPARERKKLYRTLVRVTSLLLLVIAIVFVVVLAVEKVKAMVTWAISVPSRLVPAVGRNGPVPQRDDEK